jgi:putative tryptophan/tyrosine transport system substrate-binding protein
MLIPKQVRRLSVRRLSLMMLKYGWLPLLTVMLLVGGVPAVQKQVKHHHVALLVAGVRVSVPPQVMGLHDGLQELGYILGKNLTIELLRSEDYTEVGNSLRKSAPKFDAIITTSGSETALAKEAAGTIPIIFMPAGDPVRSGLVNSLANPGTNITGLSFFGDAEEIGKQLEVFKQVVPSLRSILVLYDKRKMDSAAVSSLEAVKNTAAHLPTKVIEKPISSVAGAEEALRRMRPGAIDGIFIICSPVFRRFTTIAAIALQKKLPLFGCNASQVSDERALLTYAPDMHYIGYRAARYLDRVLKGAKPQDLPVETPKRFELVINLRTANEIGLTVPPEVLILADRVVE